MATKPTNASATGQPAIAADDRRFLRVVERVENLERTMDPRTQNHVPHRAGSSRSHAAANNARGTPNTTKRKSPSEDLDDKKKNKKKKAATVTGSGSSPSFLDPHMQNRTGERNNNKGKMIGQSSKFLCGICFDFKTDSDMFRGSKCNHPFCADCISKHVAAQINKNVVKVNCPKPNCCVELKPEHLQPILPKHVIVRWESARYESSIAWWKKTYCPFKNCSVLLVDDGAKVVTSAECPSCHRLFCAQCRVPWHAGMNCKEFQKLRSSRDEKYLDRKFLELAKSKMWQRCPKCSIYVQRSGGCEHIKCRCGCNFCYHCGKDWKFGHTCNKPRST